ncbi:MAG: hypothetical protein NVS9B1_23410 [Candidatus Dormibacteraceae bacterium]
MGNYVPELRGDLEWARLKTRHGRPNIILGDRPRRYLRLGERDDFLAQRMDGTRRVADLVVEYFEKFGTFGLKQVTGLVTTLRGAGFLVDPPRNVWTDLEARLRPDLQPKERRWTEGTAIRLKVPLRGIDGFVTRYHDTIGWVAFTRPFLVASVIVTVLGLVAFARDLQAGHDPFAPIAGSGLAGIVALVVAYYFVIFVHESSHALTCKHFGRMVPKGGFLVYYMMPAFYVDVTDAWMEPWWRRIAIFWAGPYSGFMLAGASSILALALPPGIVATVMFKLAVAAYLTNLLNLMPFLLLDGYWILEQWLEIPQMRAQALAFVRGPLWHSLWARRRLTRRELFFAVFGVISAIYTFLTVIFAAVLWRKRLLPLVTPLWATPGVLSKVITVIVVGAIAIPLSIRFGRRVWNLRSAVAAAPNMARKALFAIQMGDRMRLLGALGFLRGLPAGTSERLARAAKPREVATGEVVVRQGERGTDFYVIAAGQAAVTVLQGGEEKLLRQLKPGEFFGERALLGDGLRTATVRAVQPLKLLVFGEPTFWSELAGPISWNAKVRESLQERHRLAGLPLFADLSSRQLDLLAVKLEIKVVKKGEVIFRAGDVAEDFYIVRDGSVEAVDPHGRSLEVLREGSFFGEIALIRNRSRTATVRACEDGSLWRLGRRDFHELLGKYLDLEDQLADVADERVARDRVMGVA